MPFNIADAVFLKGRNTEVGTVVKGPVMRGGKNWYLVRWGGEEKNHREEDLEPYANQESVLDYLKSNRYAGITSFIQQTTQNRLMQPQKNVLYSFNASRTELHGYQYKPLLKYLSSTTKRLLIADEVGLGKTIEAAYILQEERARHDVDRVLIVCPSSLRIKWQNEMWERFNQRFEILNVQQCLAKIPYNPEKRLHHHLFGIVSFNTIRNDNIIDKLEEFSAALNFLIVDEVHHCRNRNTKNFKIIESLAEDASSTIFLSATPIHTGNDNLYNLMNLLLPERFSVEEAFLRQLRLNAHIVQAERLLINASQDSIDKAYQEIQSLTGTVIADDPFYSITCDRLKNERIFQDREYLVETREMLSGLNILNETLSRTRKRDVQENAPVRSANTVEFNYSPYENQVYQDIIQHIYRQYEKYYNNQVASFVLSNISRCFASSLAAAVEMYQDTFKSKSKSFVLEQELDDCELDEDYEIETQYRMVDDIEFHQIINGISASELRNGDSKYRNLKEALKNDKKAIVFAFYKRSLRYLEERLNEDGIDCVRIDGDVPSNPDDPDNDERVNRILKFKNNARYQVLLSSQVGSEQLSPCAGQKNLRVKVEDSVSNG